MQKKSIKITMTNNYADGAYTAPIYLGSRSIRVNVFLDTGSSSLAVSRKHYHPGEDVLMKPTNLAQYTAYEDKSFWQGAVINTRVTVKHGSKRRQLSNANVSVVLREKDMFNRNMQGILGLAYQPINYAYIFKKPTWPKFPYKNMESRPWTTIRPYFTQLEKNGIEPNKFALYTLRSELHYGSGSLARDPWNTGYCILGGGEEYKELYTGRFQTAKVNHDFYYNTNIRSVRLGTGKPIKVPPSTKASGLNSNSIVDSGTSTLALASRLYKKVIAGFRQINPDFIKAIQQSQQTDDIKLKAADLKKWPNIYIELEGEKGDIELKMTPQSYWQLNCTADGVAYFAIDEEPGGQTILGLPFMNNFYCVFDRSADDGLGVIKFAKIKQPE